ncbi:MAG: 30S ribosomal protein S27e [Nitrososphaeria archaeon]|nr:30S ribosomal protein S27e [Nitrososphaeria archaeon]
MSEWRMYIPQPKSRFILVECSVCSNTQAVFTHSSKVVKCNICGEILVKPTGGKALIKGKVTKRYG